jgi:signal transduction histidine kinase
MSLLQNIFINPELPEDAEKDRHRIIIFRKYLGILIIIFSIILLIELTVDFQVFEWWSFGLVIAVCSCFLLLSISNILPHRQVLAINIFSLLVIDQSALLINPQSYHVVIYWLGITPLFVAMISDVRDTVIWSVVVGLCLVLNGLYIQYQVGEYTLALYPHRFILGGVMFLGTVATMAIFYSKSHMADRTRMRLQNIKLETLTKRIEIQNKQLKEYNDHLEERIETRTRELEKRNAQLTEYAFINSHLLRAPVASILGMIDLLSRTATSDEQKQHLRHLLISSRELDNIVKQITQVLEEAEEVSRHSLTKKE